jgi:hypothetical protein
MVGPVTPSRPQIPASQAALQSECRLGIVVPHIIERSPIDASFLERAYGDRGGEGDRRLREALPGAER